MKEVKNDHPRIITQRYKINAIKQHFKRILGYDLNLSAPRTFNEKIQWMKLYCRDPLITKCSDKYAVRQYVEKKIGNEYLIPLVGKGVYKNANDIDFETLPDKFVLKITDGWSNNIICNDKSNLDLSETRSILNSWLNKGNSHYYRNFEWAYKNIKPRIICEEFIEQTGETGLLDYKFWCFNGHVEMILVCGERNAHLRKENYFDRDWNPLVLSLRNITGNRTVPQPKKLKQIIYLSELLSKDFPFVRVDVYIPDSDIKFGELTFYPSNGTLPFVPKEWDDKLGDLFVLPKKSFVFPFELNKRKTHLRAVIKNISKTSVVAHEK